MSRRPLAGVRVLELSAEIAGPYGGRLLAGLGADVIKVEPPQGDPCRLRGPFPIATGTPDLEHGGLFRYLNAGKRGIVLDVHVAAGRETLRSLCGAVDVVIESFPAGELERLGLDFAELLRANPQLVLVSVTPFGRVGTQAAWRGNDLIAFHASGMAFGFPALQVDAPELPPLNAPSYGAAFLAGEMVAGAAVHGLLAAQRSGHGCRLDLSLQEAVAAENQSQYSAFERSGGVRRTFSTAPSNPTVALLPCRDGWVAISPREEHQWARWLEVMGSPAWGAEPRFADRRSRERHWAQLYPLLAAWSAERSKAAVFESAQAGRVACYPLGEATDLLASPQLSARSFFVEERAEGAGTGESSTEPAVGLPLFPGAPYHLDGEAVPPPARAPRLGEHTDEVLEELRHAAPPAPRTATDTQEGTANAADAALEPLRGVRVVDFSWVLTGPICTKYLAALGAEVIKVESRARPDLSQRDLAWEELNPSKRSITLNLQQPQARELVRTLIAQSDVVIENFSTGVMERLGLDYATLSTTNPGLVMLSSSALGRTGPERERVAYGTLIQCFTGWAGLAAHPGLPPRSAAGIWTDPLTATQATLLILAGILQRRESGRGCFIDLSMAETTIAALPEPLLTWALRREVLQPRGNRDPLFAPQGCYPAAGPPVTADPAERVPGGSAPESVADRGAGQRPESASQTSDTWLAISVMSDAEWPAFCRAIARDDLAADPELTSASGRQAQHERLDEAIIAWTRQRPAAESAALLQAAGIAATPTLTVADVLADEHLTARRFLSQVERIDGGTRRTLGFPWLINDERPNRFRRPPRVGEDNEAVFKGLLQLDEAEYARLVVEQAIY